MTAFTNWLTQYNQVGYIGEVGWPVGGATAWNQVAETFFSVANPARLWSTAWAVGEMWGSYQLQPYVLQNGSWTTNPQASVLEETANLSTANYKRGVNIAGAEFGTPDPQTATSTFSNQNPGVAGTDYVWNSASTYQYMYSRGHRLARIPFRWERIQPVLGAALDTNELARMRTSIMAAQTAGLEIILDVHNYGAYWLYDSASGSGIRRSVGTAQVTFAHFADLWTRLATEFNSYPGVIGYGLMNEPVSMTGVNGMTPAQTWAYAAQSAVDAIRAVAVPQGMNPKTILVGGYEWSGTWSLDANHDGPFVTDSLNLIRYEAHQYFDADSSGRYNPNELNPVVNENLVKWEPNPKQWQIAAEIPSPGSRHTVEVFRAGSPAPISTQPMWMKGAADKPVTPCTPGSTGCNHKTFEYVVVVTDTVDGSRAECATSISGPYQN